MNFADERRSLLSSQARIQVPWVRAQIGVYVFGVRDRKKQTTLKNADGFYVGPRNNELLKYFPDFITSLSIVKVNGKVNTYTLNISYPVTQFEDPNFFEKVLSSVSKTREITFTYGDAAQPNYIYKDETALITDVTQNFNMQGSVINYTISAVSNGMLASSGSYTFPKKQNAKPSDEIKALFKNPQYGLKSLFTGMNDSNIDELIAGDDAPVQIRGKIGTSILDYITYLVSCMMPSGSTTSNKTRDIYILTLHDETVYDTLYNNTISKGGPYFQVTRVSQGVEFADAYTLDIGYNTSTIVSQFSVSNNANYAILFDYQTQLNPQRYVTRLNQFGQQEKIYAPAVTSNNEHWQTRPQDITWWTKITEFPITASITIQGLLRPAHLLTYLRLNVIFPGGRKHISSGLYIVTQQQDQIDGSGYKTTLQLTKIAGDKDLQLGMGGNPVKYF